MQVHRRVICDIILYFWHEISWLINLLFLLLVLCSLYRKC